MHNNDIIINRIYYCHFFLKDKHLIICPYCIVLRVLYILPEVLHIAPTNPNVSPNPKTNEMQLKVQNTHPI